MKEFRIYVNNIFQFSVKTDRSPQALATSARETMGLTGVRAVVTPGVINFIPA